MKAPLITFAITLIFTLPTLAQTDSLYYVHRLDGATLYSNKVKLVNSLTHGKYLLLDSSRRITLDQARDFKGWDGTFAVGMIGGKYDVFRLRNEGRRISLYSQCYYETETVWSSPVPGQPQTPSTITSNEKAWFFRKGAEGAIERVTISNLRTAMADNPASLAQVKVAGTNLAVSLGLMAAGAAVAIGGILHSSQQNANAYNTYKQESAAWYNNSMTNPNAPPPTLNHYGISPLFYVGTAMAVSGIIPLSSVKKHLRNAIDIYNGVN